MDLCVLRELNFTEGEIKVLGALVKLQKSTISKIIELSGVSSSKVYSILDKLVHKGLVSYISSNKIKEFQLSNPENLLDYIKTEKERIENVESKANSLIKEMKKSLQKYQKEEANIYRGIQGVKSAHFNLLNELKKGDEYVFFSVEQNMLEQKSVQLMFKSIHNKRDGRGIRSRGIAQPKLKKIFKKAFTLNDKYQIRYHELTLNQGITIGKDRIIIENTFPEPFAVEIISPQTAKSYREFFNHLWKLAKKEP
jgi:HTH-type transcriptional regulator, sugar sensing transcriptional regulator